MARISLMGGTFLSFVVMGSLLVAAEDTDYPTSCPKKDPKDYSIQLPHESDCTKYYMCARGKKYIKTCPVADEETGERLFFNPEIHACDWASNVDCEQPESTLPLLSVHTKLSAPLDILPVPTKCPKKESKEFTVHLQHEFDCTKYYKCQYGKPILQNCACLEDGSRLYFNKFKQVCDFSFNVDCESNPNLATPCPASRDAGVLKLSARREILPVPTKCPKTDSILYTVHLKHESDCTKFYKCTYGKPIPQDCPCQEDGTRLYFNEKQQVCDFPFNVDCESDYRLATPCDGGYHPIDPVTPTSTTRHDRVDTPTPPTSPSPPPLGCRSTCPNNDPPNKITPLPHNDCRKWCRCENHRATVHICPNNFHFSPTLGTCTTPESAGCIPIRPFINF